MRALNDAFMDARSFTEAAKGLDAMTRGTLLPGVRIYRFASALDRSRLFARPWWVGFTPFDTMMRYSRASGRPLREVARECLAVDWDWGQMDTLVSATVAQTLAVWAGTPKTQKIALSLRAPAGENRTTLLHLRDWEPDRSITQYYIAGLDERGWVYKDWGPGAGGLLVEAWQPASASERRKVQPLWEVALGQRQEQHLHLLQLGRGSP